MYYATNPFAFQMDLLFGPDLGINKCFSQTLKRKGNMVYKIMLITLFMTSSLIASPCEDSMLNQMLPANPFVIPADKVDEILQCTGLEVEELLQKLIPIAKSYARPPISEYKVGVAALGKSGAIYLGVNLEFLGTPLNCCIHGEQFLVTHARNYGESELVAIALSAAPCGHCRQFLNEIGGNSSLVILTPHSPQTTLAELLPADFGPRDLGLEGNLLSVADQCPIVFHASKIIARAIEAANASYAPYSKAKSGVAIRTSDGKIYIGSHLENAAFNPSISPLQAALVALIADQRDYSEIQEVALYEQADAKISHEGVTREILANIAPDAKVIVEKQGF